MFSRFTKAATILSSVCIWAALGQQPAPVPSVNNTTYALGAGDEITISVADAEELSQLFANPFTLDSDGYVTVPLAGRLHAADLTPSQLADQIRDGLRKYVRDPLVSVNLKTMRSQSVSVLGAVNNPGVHQVTGPKTLDEMLALAGGLSKDAGCEISITRERKWGLIPLSGAVMDPSGQFSTAQVNTRQLNLAKDPAENITVRPNDVITVPRAEVVYVLGEVKKPGGFTLGDRKSVTALEVLSLAEGPTNTASQARALILRTIPGSTERTKEKINLKKVMQGKVKDFELTANDILYVPDNSTKRAGIKTAEVALQTISGVIIWRGL